MLAIPQTTVTTTRTVKVRFDLIVVVASVTKKEAAIDDKETENVKNKESGAPRSITSSSASEIS